ncbi:TRAP-type C4-dicarboxylate transport system permease small subunit [Alkalibacillus filiformis]|uniref:TRAP-type C4-dicarboxylate transport system permease small subunit n=1 Tax=Alkalibacillus filiformis TaxID=200990 RepID=A0ABU0DV94_9BACI|nr:TRAP transporter small permease [Alkalibacillus filiformis]MDQ0352351.1 TRAP-type C4-dicarboxylate transport system permease small subunit [Alkalibacillus filiformis]
MTRWLNNIEEFIVVSVLAVMSIIAFTNVLSRNFIGISLSFTEEVTVNLFVLLTFVGAAIGVRKHAHLGFTLLFDIAPKSLKKIISIIVTFVSIFFFVSIAYFGYEMIDFQRTINSTTPALGWPRWLFSLALPVGAALCIIRTIQVFVLEWRSINDEEVER